MIIIDEETIKAKIKKILRENIKITTADSFSQDKKKENTDIDHTPMIVDGDAEIKDVVEKDIIVSNAATLKIRGIVNGAVTVESGCELVVKGILNGNLTVQENAVAKIKGMMNGDVAENSGVIKVSGMVVSDKEIPGQVKRKSASVQQKAQENSSSNSIPQEVNAIHQSQKVNRKPEKLAQQELNIAFQKQYPKNLSAKQLLNEYTIAERVAYFGMKDYNELFHKLPFMFWVDEIISLYRNEALTLSYTALEKTNRRNEMCGKGTRTLIDKTYEDMYWDGMLDGMIYARHEFHSEHPSDAQKPVPHSQVDEDDYEQLMEEHYDRLDDDLEDYDYEHDADSYYGSEDEEDDEYEYDREHGK